MIVPIDLLRPILDDLLAYGRPNRPARPWLGLYAAEIDDRIVVVGVAERRPGAARRPAQRRYRARRRRRPGRNLAGLFRRVWSLGDAGVAVPLTVSREGEMIELRVASADRNSFLKAPRLH